MSKTLRKKFILGNTEKVLRNTPKGQPIGEGTIKVKIFKGKGAKGVIHLPKGTEITMTKGKFMVASKQGFKKALKKDAIFKKGSLSKK